MKNIDTTKLTLIGNDEFRYSYNKKYTYYKKTNCVYCGKVLYQLRVDYRLNKLCFCRDTHCRANYNKQNDLNIKYPAGYTEELSDGRVRYYTGRTWSYRNKYKCACCGAAIYKESSNNIINHFCSKKCKSQYYNNQHNIIQDKDIIRDCSIVEPNIHYNYSDLAQQSEYNIITSITGTYNRKPAHNRIVLSHQPHFYEVENELWKDSDIKNKLLQNREKYLKKSREELTQREILRGFKISGIHIGYSHFSPFWIKRFITDNNIQSVYDFCGGWGHRLLGCHNIKYIYNDWDPRTYQGCVNIAKDFNLNKAVFYNRDSSKFTPSDDYEAVFTCPPYYNTEIYNYKQFKDLEDYIQWWKNSLVCAIKPSVRTVAYVINHIYLDKTKQVCRDIGLNHIEDIELHTSKSHFNRKQFSSKREVLVHFKV